MKFLFASDSFKGTLTSERIISILDQAAHEVFPDCVCAGIPVADGGEGTMEAVRFVTGGDRIKLEVHNPVMKRINAEYVILPDKSAMIEMAAASGLPLLSDDQRNPLETTTYGTGELIGDALERGCRNIIIAIGGSATNDGGMGALKALGVRFFDHQGAELNGLGKDLERVADIDLSGLHPAVSETKFSVMCDVTNPLTGGNGATYTFGKQKGGTKDILDRLETGMLNYQRIIEDKLDVKVNSIPGAGAAGGLGAGLCVFLHATMKSGIEIVLDMIDFDRLLEDVDLVITGEGRIDWQSAFGKVVSGIGMRCKNNNVPAVAIVGGMGDKAESIYDYGIASIITTVNGIMSLEEASERVEELYLNAAVRAFRMIKTGLSIGGK